MTFLLFIILLLIAIFFVWLQRFRWAAGGLILALLWLLSVGQGWFPQWVLSHLQSKSHLTFSDWKEKNVIIVLGLGLVKWPDSPYISTNLYGYSRLFETSRLYFQCRLKSTYCRVLVTGGDPGKNGISEAEVMKSEIQNMGIPESEILTESRSHNTFQNAEFSSALLKESSFDQWVLVTSGFHLERALLYFSHFNVNTVGAASDHIEPPISFLPNALNFTFADLAMHECLGILRYHIYQWMGWNYHPSKPGST